MSELWKYVILSDGQKEYPIIFARELSHVDVAHGVMEHSRYSEWSKIPLPLRPVAAGFCAPDASYMDAKTKSESLGVGPRAGDLEVLRGERNTALPATSQPPSAKPPRSLLDKARSARAR